MALCFLKNILQNQGNSMWHMGLQKPICHILSFPLLASFLHVWPFWQCYLQEVSHLTYQQDATNLLSHSLLFPWCLQLLCPDNFVSDKNNDVNRNMRRRNQNTHMVISAQVSRRWSNRKQEHKTIHSFFFFFLPGNLHTHPRSFESMPHPPLLT